MHKSSTLYLCMATLLCLAAVAENVPNLSANSNLPFRDSSLSPASPEISWYSKKLERYRESILQSILMVIVSEIGDKTFLIAAILAMRHSRFVIFSASCAALWLMSLLSAVLGNIAINFVSTRLVSLLACITFLCFGIKMCFEAKEMKNDEIDIEMGNIQTELSTIIPTPIPISQSSDTLPLATDALDHPTDHKTPATDSLDKLPSADYAVKIDDLDYSSQIEAQTLKNNSKNLLSSCKNLLSFLLSPIFVQVFVMLFVAEWGDRSQLATIALAASNEIWSVTIGTIIGHTLCTGLAVLGGKYLAQKISPKVLTIIGAGMFIIFSLIYFREFLYSPTTTLKTSS
ncbi:hypothetical protein BB561_002463 [Smittium simulii]|uniref:GDT1 family protein n=1 Tax=Smittium simulii TaxID=133385 RepID=A0A2T9YQG1_9FUNG|nr:hypothetical protein BB561_002463 [Smittium simulii]